MYCKHCGKEISDDSTFCKYCGNDPSGAKVVNTPTKSGLKFDISIKAVLIAIAIGIWVIVLQNFEILKVIWEYRAHYM